MDKVGLELPTLTSQVEELEKKLKQAQKDAEYAELTDADIETAIVNTLSKKTTFWSQEIAKKSGCGFDANAINRPNKKKNREIARLAKKSIDAKYQACKLEVKDNYDSNEIQFSALVIKDVAGRDISGMSASSTCPRSPPGEDATKALTNNVHDKFLCFSDHVDLIATFSSPTTVGGYDIFTANDWTPRDPKSWVFSCRTSESAAW